MKEVKHIIFDVDGVVTLGYPRASEIAVEKYGLDASLIKAFFKTRWQKCVEGGICIKELLTEELPQWGFRGSVEDYLNFWFETENAINHEIISIVKKLRVKGVKCHLGSNQERMRADYLWNISKLFEHFESPFFSCYMRCSKPNSSFYKHISSSLDIPPEEILLVDDAIENIKAAKGQGWHALLWPTEKGLLQSMAKE